MSASDHNAGATQHLRICAVSTTTPALLAWTLIEPIVIDTPAHLIVDISDVEDVGDGELCALVYGYRTAIDYGVSLRVVNPCPQVRERIRAAGLLDLLSNGDDLAALLVAVAMTQA
jgi:anti-anti-sigma regulatory factor